MKPTLPLWAEILIEIDNWLNIGQRPYALKISRKIDRTYSSIVKNINFLQEKGILETKKEGRIVYLNMSETKKAQELITAIKTIRDNIIK